MNVNEQLCATGIIINDKKEILLAKRALDDDFMPGEWDLPGGGLEQGEDLEVGLYREIFEECGIEVEVIKEVGTSEYMMGDLRRLETIFLCKPLTWDINLSPEHTAYKWIKYSEIEQIELTDYVKKLLKMAESDLA